VAVIGEVVNFRDKLNWFERGPLFGNRIVVTRAQGQAAGLLASRLQELGAEVLDLPTIKFEPPTHREDVIDALLSLNSYDWLFLTYPQGDANLIASIFPS